MYRKTKVIRWLIAGVVAAVLSHVTGGFLLHVIWAQFCEGARQNLRFAGAVPWGWIVLLQLFGGWLFALIYALFYKGLPGRGIRKGVSYGFFIWVVYVVIYFFINMYIVTVPIWILGGLVSSMLSGVAVAAIFRRTLEG